jgi:hypothetical protein
MRFTLYKLFLIVLIFSLSPINVFGTDKIVFKNGLIKYKKIDKVYFWGISYEDAFNSSFKVISSIYTSNPKVVEKFTANRADAKISIESDSLYFIDLSTTKLEFPKIQIHEILNKSNILLFASSDKVSRFNLLMAFNPNSIGPFHFITGFSYGDYYKTKKVIFGSDTYKLLISLQSYNFVIGTGYEKFVLGNPLLFQLKFCQKYQFYEKSYSLIKFNDSSYSSGRGVVGRPGRTYSRTNSTSLGILYKYFFSSSFYISSGIEYNFLNEDIFQKEYELKLQFGIGYKIQY